MPEMPNTGSNRKAQTAGLGNQAKLVSSQKWPTPDAAMHQGANTSQGPAGARPNIALATAMWLTPNVPNGGRSVSPELVASHGMTETGEKRTVGLESQTRHWPTPASRDYRTPNSQESQESRKHTGGEQLPNYIEHHFLPLAPLIPPGVTFSVPVISVHGAELSPTTRPEHVLGRLRLNPAFGCWLMGWPLWWTNPGLTSFAKSEMVSYRSALQQQLSYFFDAQAL